MRRLLILPGALAVAAMAGLVFAAGAWAPPAEGVPDIVVSKRCVVYGQKIPVRGGGFSPNTSVTLSAPFGHYTPPSLTFIRDVSVTADEEGGISGELTAPPLPKRDPSRFEARVILVTGTAQAGEGEGSSFDEIVIGTPQVCHELLHPSPRGSGPR